MPDALLGEGVRVLVLGSGKIGHEINALGVVEALGAPYELRRVEPRAWYARLAPYGPVDPKDKPGAAGSIFPHPPPDVAISSGRVTVPYMRALKRACGRRVFAVFLQDPRHARSEMDLIWTPEHDSSSRRQRDHDADLAAPVLPGRASRRRGKPRILAAGLASRSSVRGRPRGSQRRQTFHAGRRRAPGRGDPRDRRPGFQRHGDALAPHAARTSRRGSSGARRVAGLRMGWPRRQPLSCDPRARRRRAGDRRQRQHGGRSDRDRRAGAYIRAVGRRIEEARGRDRNAGPDRGGAAV